MSFLVGARVSLCPLSINDLEGGYSEWINSQENDYFTQHAQFPHTRESLVQYFNQKSQSKNDLWLAIKLNENNKHIGNIEIGQIDWVHKRGTYAILLGDPEESGKGYAFEASELIIEHAFNKLNLHRIQLGVHEHNSAAINLYKKIGFKEEGVWREYFLRNGKYYNMIFMSLLLNEFNSSKK